MQKKKIKINKRAASIIFACKKKDTESRAKLNLGMCALSIAALERESITYLAGFAGEKERWVYVYTLAVESLRSLNELGQ